MNDEIKLQQVEFKYLDRRVVYSLKFHAQSSVFSFRQKITTDSIPFCSSVPFHYTGNIALSIS